MSSSESTAFSAFAYFFLGLYPFLGCHLGISASHGPPLLEWNEPTLIEQVKEFVILTELEDFADLLEEIQEEMGEQEEGGETPSKSDEANPYN